MKHTWLKKPQNFEHVPSNFSHMLIRGFFEMFRNVTDVWFPYKMCNGLMKRLIFLLHMPKGNIKKFHVRNYFFS